MNCYYTNVEITLTYLIYEVGNRNSLEGRRLFNELVNNHNVLGFKKTSQSVHQRMKQAHFNEMQDKESQIQ